MRWPFVRRRPESAAPLEPQAAYALWAKHYPPRPHNPLMEVEHRTVLALLPAVHGRTVLDAGCGTGRYLQELKARGAFVIGMDLSAAMLTRARTVSSSVARADLRALPFDTASIDVAVCGLAFGDVEELDVALAELGRVVRPGGCVIYSVVHPSGEALGWSRSFDADGRRVAIASHWHSVERHRTACALAGLSIDEWQEPEVVSRPGQRAVLVVRCRKTTES